MRTAYTHSEHMRRAGVAALQRSVIENQPVCVVKRGIRYCATIVNAWTSPAGIECWTVQASLPEVCRFTASSRNVFVCSCFGALDTDTQAKREAGASAPKDK